MAITPPSRGQLLTVALSIGLALTISEIGVRIFEPQRTYASLLELLGSQYAASPFNPFTLKKNHRGHTPVMDFPGVRAPVTTNALGLRNREISAVKPGNTVRVLVLGDSYTFGVYVGDEEPYAAVADASLRDAGYDAEVVNAGYAAGWETDEHYCWLMNRGFALQPDIVVLGFFVGNDIMNIKPEQWVDLDARGLPRKIVDPTIYLDNVGRLRSTTKDDLKTVGDQFVYRIPVLRNSHYAVLLGRTVEDGFSRVRARPVAKFSDGGHPHIFKERDASFDRQERYFLKLVRALHEETSARGVRFMVLMIPFNYQVEPRFLYALYPERARDIRRGTFRIRRNYFEDLKPKLDGWGIEHLDSFQLMRETPGHYYPDNGEVHFNADGHRFVGEHLARRLIELGWITEEGRSTVVVER